MKQHLRRSTIVAALCLGLLAGATPAFAQEGGATNGGNTDVATTVIWALAIIGIGAVLLGCLYLFKRQVGGFPENPEWVAPISIQYSKDLPVEDSGAGHGDVHGDTHADRHAPEEVAAH
jgi:Na+-driven multidrug efflux pump